MFLVCFHRVKNRELHFMRHVRAGTSVFVCRLGVTRIYIFIRVSLGFSRCLFVFCTRNRYTCAYLPIIIRVSWYCVGVQPIYCLNMKNRSASFLVEDTLKSGLITDMLSPNEIAEWDSCWRLEIDNSLLNQNTRFADNPTAIHFALQIIRSQYNSLCRALRMFIISPPQPPAGIRLFGPCAIFRGLSPSASTDSLPTWPHRPTMGLLVCALTAILPLKKIVAIFFPIDWCLEQNM